VTLTGSVATEPELDRPVPDQARCRLQVETKQGGAAVASFESPDQRNLTYV
jgi:hypothetical protein